jgi:hypothetical protein
MNGQLHYWWAKERMHVMHDEAARRGLVRGRRRPLSLAVGDLLVRLGGALARRASDHRPHEQLPAADRGVWVDLSG